MPEEEDNQTSPETGGTTTGTEGQTEASTRASDQAQPHGTGGECGAELPLDQAGCLAEHPADDGEGVCPGAFSPPAEEKPEPSWAAIAVAESYAKQAAAYRIQIGKADASERSGYGLLDANDSLGETVLLGILAHRRHAAAPGPERPPSELRAQDGTTVTFGLADPQDGRPSCLRVSYLAPEDLQTHVDAELRELERGQLGPAQAVAASYAKEAAAYRNQIVMRLAPTVLDAPPDGEADVPLTPEEAVAKAAAWTDADLPNLARKEEQDAFHISRHIPLTDALAARAQAKVDEIAARIAELKETICKRSGPVVSFVPLLAGDGALVVGWTARFGDKPAAPAVDEKPQKAKKPVKGTK